jgi:hypothetical protein
VTGDDRFLIVGLQSLEFLLADYRDEFDFVGNQGWFRRSERAVFGQQPSRLDTAEACLTAYEITAEHRYLDLAHAAAVMVVGRNLRGAADRRVL